MSVSAVVVTYNRLTMLKEALEALKQSDIAVDHVIVVDNNSDADTQQYLTSLGNQIEYVRLNENLGGAGGFNRGVRYFMEHTDDDYVWLMDDDTMVHHDTLTQLITQAEQNPNFGFLSSDVRWTDGTRTVMNQPASINRLRVIPDDATEPEQVRSATFVSLFVKRDVVHKIGLPITEFFIWGDDIEYTERARRLAPGYFVPKAKVTHKMSTNVGSDIIKDTKDRTQRYYYSYRNKVYYVQKRNFIGRVRSNLRITAETLRLIFWPKPVENRWGKVAVIIAAVRDGRKFNPEIEYV